MLNALIKDWQVNGTVAAYSGTPFTVTASNTALDQRGNLQTADLVGEREARRHRAGRAVLRPGGVGERDRARYGNTGRNQFYGPGFWNYNMSLFRTFPLQRPDAAAVPRGGVQPHEPSAVVEPERQRHQRQLHADHQHAR